MDGIGLYIWPDSQKRYVGEYRSHNKHGYGIFTARDGRVHAGHWRNGKGHGLGTFTRHGKQMLYGIWEDGQQNMWFDEATVTDIASGVKDAREFFLKAHNKKQEIS